MDFEIDPGYFFLLTGGVGVSRKKQELQEWYCLFLVVLILLYCVFRNGLEYT